MSDSNSPPTKHEFHSPKPDSSDSEEPSTGPSLTLLYSLIGLALLFAVGFALLIVAPFHHRH